MTDDEFDDILDEVYHYFPDIATDPYALAGYTRAVASVNNTGGEEQRAQLQELIAELQSEREDEEAARAAEEDDEREA